MYGTLTTHRKKKIMVRIKQSRDGSIMAAAGKKKKKKEKKKEVNVW